MQTNTGSRHDPRRRFVRLAALCGLFAAFFLLITLGRAPYTSSQLTDHESSTGNEVFMRAHPPGTIVIVLDDNGDDGTFNFDSDIAVIGSPAECTAFGLTKPGDTTQVCSLVDIGTYTITETVPPGDWTVSIDCVESVDGNSTDLGAEATIVLDDAETVTCTFTNTADPGSITIVQESTPADGHAFLYNLSANLISCDGDLLVTLSDNDVDPNDQECSGLPPDTYMIEQQVDAGWPLDTPITCTGQDESTVTPAGSQVEIALVAGEDVECTFENVD